MITKKTTNIYIFLIIIFGVFIRAFNINFEDLWSDEMVSFWLSNPDFNLATTIQLISESNLTFTFEVILKYFHLIFGYDVYVSRYINLIFSSLSLYFFFILLKNNSINYTIAKNNNIIYFGLLLLVLNIFHIRYAMELRSYTLTFLLFLILLNEIFSNGFIKIEISKTRYFRIILITFSMLLSHAFSLLIIISINIYILTVFFLKKKIYKTHKNIFFINIVVSLIFLIIYLNNINHSPYWITQLKLSFYTNYYFSNFFGSRLMGGIYLIVFIYLIFKYLKLNLYNQNINLFFIILFFTTYLIPIIYSYLFVPILNPRYIFFVIVPILFLISDLLFYEKNKVVKKFILLLILFSTFLNHFTENTFKQFYSQIYPSKPTIKTALKHISNSDIQDYSFLLDENNSLNINSVYKNYLQKYSSKIDNELNYINYTENNFNKNKIWLINITDITSNKVLTMPAILSNYKILTKKEFNHVKIYLLEKN